MCQQEAGAISASCYVSNPALALLLSGEDSAPPFFMIPLNTPFSLLTVAPKDRAATLRPLLGPGKVLRGEGRTALKEAQVGEAWFVDQISPSS